MRTDVQAWLPVQKGWDHAQRDQPCNAPAGRSIGADHANERAADAGTGHPEPALRSWHGQGVHAGCLPRLANAAGAQVAELHDSMG